MRSDLTIPTGSYAHVLFAFEAAAHINLDKAQALVSAAATRESIRGRARTPEYFEFRPAPLRVDIPVRSLTLGGKGEGRSWSTSDMVEVTLYDFGALAVTYRVPIAGRLEDLYDLADVLYENAELLADARQQAEAILKQVAPAVRRSHLASLVEDYVIYRVASPPGVDLSGTLSDAAFRRDAAKLLRAEAGEPSPQEVEDAMGCVISFTPSDATIIDWNAALVVGADSDDVLAVLEFANVELLEMRYMDDRLDEMLDEAYDAEQDRPRGVRRLLGLDKGRTRMRRLSAMHLDSALLFEGVNNALKLVGDQFLARVYRLAAARLHLPDWDASILRKLSTLQRLQDQVSDEQATIRMEILEVMIILLIMVSIVIPFVTAAGK
jgi:hypothetical protein